MKTSPKPPYFGLFFVCDTPNPKVRGANLEVRGGDPGRARRALFKQASLSAWL